MGAEPRSPRAPPAHSPPSASISRSTTLVPASVPPLSFLADVGGGNEQAAVVATATGHIVRPISAAPSGQELFAVSPDGRTLYAPTQLANACDRSYQAIDIATGVSRGPAFVGLSDLTGVAPSPDGQTLAYTAGCGTAAGIADVYLRRPDGTTTFLPSGGQVVQMSWSHDGTMLAFETFDTPGSASVLQVWTIGPNSITGPKVVPAPDPGCALSLPRFAGNGLFAVEQCPAKAAQASSPVTLRLVLLDPATGSMPRSWALASAPSAIAADLTVDPTGGWALYSLDTSSVSGQVSLLDLGPTASPPRVLLSHTFEVAWLPPAASG
jgi:hypothetical protein